MVDEAGNIQLIDFGVAGIVLTNMQEDKRKTIIGTAHWMPPELHRQAEEIEHGTEVDVWAFGITLYECVMGRPPNAHIANPRQLGTVTRRSPPRITDDTFSAELRDLIAFVLEPDPSKRPTMDQVCQHPYIAGTEKSHPTKVLRELVENYYRWEITGGQRMSLWNDFGAGKVTLNGEDNDEEEWSFSTTDNFEKRMSELNPSFRFPPEPSIPEEDALADSPPPEEDYESQLTARFTPTPKGKAPIRQDAPKVPAITDAMNERRVNRGAKHMQGLFDESADPYKYTYGKSSDLPLRQGPGSSSFHRQELSISSNASTEPINLDSITNVRGQKRSTMAWTWDDGAHGMMGNTTSRNSLRASNFFADLPGARPSLRHAATAPVGIMEDNRNSTLDLDALMGMGGSSSFDISRNDDGFGPPFAPISNNFMEEPLDSFEADMSMSSDPTGMTMRYPSYVGDQQESHNASNVNIGSNLVSSPADSSFNGLPSLRSTSPESPHAQNWQSNYRAQQFEDNTEGSSNFQGGTGPPLPFRTECRLPPQPMFGVPEALDSRAPIEMLGSGLGFHIQQLRNAIEFAGNEIIRAGEEELSHWTEIHGEDHSDESNGEDDEEDDGYIAGHEYAENGDDGEDEIPEGDHELDTEGTGSGSA
jgi:serine/threonine protein kinase